MLVMSTPIVLTDGLATAGADRSGAGEPDAFEQVGAGPEVLLGEVFPGPGVGGHPGHGDVPASSCSVASSRASAIIASGAGPPKTPECRGCSRVLTVTMHATSPRSAVVRTGSPTRRLPMSQTTNSVAVEEFRVGLDERLHVALGLLHALQDEPDGARRPAVEDAHRAEVADDSGLVVGGAATVDPAVGLVGWRPWIGGPTLLRGCGLYVVVRVEHHRRRALGPADLAVDRRVSAGDRHQPGVGEPDLAEHLQRLVGHRLHGFSRVAGEGYRRDRHQPSRGTRSGKASLTASCGDLGRLHGRVLSSGRARGQSTLHSSSARCLTTAHCWATSFRESSRSGCAVSSAFLPASTAAST